MSISWDMTRRDQTSLGVIGSDNTAGSWRDRIVKSYDVWKHDMDTFHANMDAIAWVDPNLAGEEGRTTRYAGYQDFAVAYNSLYHAAHITLLAEILDLQIYAGARHILGRPVTRVDYTRSQKVVKKWANESLNAAAKAAWHSAWILREAFEHEGGIVIDSYHHPWVLFLATLTIWSFYHARPLACAAQDDDEMIWDPKAHMQKLLDHMTKGTPSDLLKLSPPSGRNSTAGMAAVVVGQLSKIRWGVIHDGMVILKGLVPWRLINERKNGL